MTEITQEEEDLLEKAIAEENSYNWKEAAKLYEQIAKSYLAKGDKNNENTTYDKIANVLYRHGYLLETAQKDDRKKGGQGNLQYIQQITISTR